LVAGLVTAVVLLAGSVVATASWVNGGRSVAGTVAGWTSTGPGARWGGMMDGRVRSAVPQLEGTSVQVTAFDMGAMMGGGGRMGLALDRASVPAGTVSLVLSNAGFRTHELVVLPLADGQQVGTRTVGSDGTVDESGSLGEASRSGGAGSGDGITADTAGWTTVQLPAGRYELICNLPGHYAAGMYAELTVS
jgi:uncharacterized cupredoxin-like copper-binding protein